MRTYRWYLFRLGAILLLIVAVRVGISFVAVNYVGGDIAELESMLYSIEEGVPIEEIALGAGGGGAGDPGRAGQEIHDDLSREGQVVMRDGVLVVLVDASDPDNEVWEPLDPADRTSPPWILRTGWGPTVGAVVGGLGLYWVGWALGGLVFGFGRDQAAG